MRELEGHDRTTRVYRYYFPFARLASRVLTLHQAKYPWDNDCPIRCRVSFLVSIPRPRHLSIGEERGAAIYIYGVYKRSLASSLRGVQDNRAANLGSLRKCCYSDSEMTFPRLWKVYRKVGRLIARFNYLGAFEEERGFVELSDSKSWSFAIIIT